MANYEIRPLQLRILEILKAIHTVCKEHNLRYYIWAGTMLGAVRHKGFIPWDDDMDICMPRPDYDAFMANAKEWLPQPFEANCMENNEQYPVAFGKVSDASTTLIEREHYDHLGGIYVDVFPIDGVPSSSLARRWVCFKYWTCDKLLYFVNRDPFKHGRDATSYIVRFIQRLFTKRGLQRRLHDMRVKYEYDKSRYVLDYDDGYKGIINKDILGTPTPVEFEGVMLNGVEKADEYLSTKYGDYMTIPDGDHQRQHNFFYLDYNLPYKDYNDRRSFIKH